MKSGPRYHIGIDGGVKTGFAVWDAQLQQFITIDTLSFWQVFGAMEFFMAKMDEVLVWVEDPSKNKPVFMKKGADNRSKVLKVAQNVGGVKRETELLIEGLELEGYQVRRVQPTSAKWDSKLFKSITGYEKRVSQHARDATKLVFGR